MSSKFSDELVNLFESEDSHLFDPPKRNKSLTAEERLVDSFNEIQNFVEKNDKNPDIASEDIIEATLGKRLLSIKSNKSQIESLIPYDRFGLLEQSGAPKSFEEFLESEDLFFSSEASKILNVRPSIRKQHAGEFEKKAERTVCKDFEKFKPLFNEIKIIFKLSKNTKCIFFNKVFS